MLNNEKLLTCQGRSQRIVFDTVWQVKDSGANGINKKITTPKKRPCTTTLKMSLLSSLCLSVCLCLCLCEVLLSCCGVLWYVVSCVCGVVCVRCGVVCDTLKNRVHSTRPRVYVQNVSVCTGTTRTHVETNGDVLNVHTKTIFIG